MPLPRLHPIYKTFVDLRRCHNRLTDYLRGYPEDDYNNSDLYLDMIEKIEALMEQIPDEYKHE